MWLPCTAAGLAAPLLLPLPRRLPELPAPRCHPSVPGLADVCRLHDGCPTHLVEKSHCSPAELPLLRLQSLGWQIFFACMMAVLTSDTMRSVQAAIG